MINWLTDALTYQWDNDVRELKKTKKTHIISFLPLVKTRRWSLSHKHHSIKISSWYWGISVHPKKIKPCGGLHMCVCVYFCVCYLGMVYKRPCSGCLWSLSDVCSCLLWTSGSRVDQTLPCPSDSVTTNTHTHIYIYEVKKERKIVSEEKKTI